MSAIENIIKLHKFKKQWHKCNLNNYTYPANLFDERYVHVGEYSYGALNIFNDGNKASLTIGSFCSIARDVKFMVTSDHVTDYLSTYPFKAMILHKEPFEAVTKGNIIIDDDVWIGQNAVILSGIHIGQGAAIAAGAVVTKDVPPYAIVGGVPAQVIKYRFPEDVIKILLSIDYSKLSKQLIEEHIDDLYSSFSGLNAEEVKQRISWMPKR